MVVKASASFLLDVSSIPLSSHTKDFKIVLTAVLAGAQHEKEYANKKADKLACVFR